MVTPRRIAIDARIINTSTGTYVQRLLLHLQRLDSVNEYTVLVPSKDLSFWKPQRENFTVLAEDSSNYSFAEQVRFLRSLNRGKYDLVHFCMPQQPVLYRGPAVTTFHDFTLLKTVNTDKNYLLFRFKQMVGRFAFLRAARRSKALLVPTEFTKHELLSRYPWAREKTLVTYEAAELESDEIQPVELPFDSYLLYVGSHSGYKNVMRLVDAHQLLRREYPDLGLVLVGGQSKASDITRAHVSRTGAQGVHFTGFVSVPERNYLYSRATAYVFPSMMEGFGLPGLEAMLWDTPVVSSSATCLPEVYADAAEYFDPASVDDMSRAIRAVLEDEARRSKLIAAGRSRVAQFSWERMARQTLSAYVAALPPDRRG